MSSSTQGLETPTFSLCGLHAQIAHNTYPLSSLTLHGGLKVSIVRPGRSTAFPLETPGTYFCINLAGRHIVNCGEEAEGAASCRPHVLQILRQPEGRNPRCIEFNSRTSVAVVVCFPLTWCASCPRGSGCRVGQFLRCGAGDETTAPDEEIELDAQGRAHAKALLELRVEEDVSILSAEQLVLALLSWAYAKHATPRPETVVDPSLSAKTLSKLRLAADTLSQRLDDPPTISELSALVGMNECDLKRCFKCMYGEGVASFSRNKRLAAAQSLLKYSTLSIAEIAFEVGYANPSQFARAFRLVFEVNPAEYRRSPG